LLIAACYTGWAAIGLIVWPDYSVVALVGLGILLALQSSLMHEVCHGHPTRRPLLNELMVGLPIGLIYPYRRFKAIHLRHHADERLTDPFDDPESFYKALWKYQKLPAWLRAVLVANNTMLGRFVLGPLLGTAGFLIEEWQLVRKNEPGVRRAWVHHVLGLVVVLPIVQFGFGIPLWLYLLVPVWLGQSLIAIRTFAEHQWSERPDGRTIIVERSPLSLLFLNNNLHFVHHNVPAAAWYRLPALFRERRAEWIRRNGNYVYPTYFALFRDFAVQPKEPVAHPVLRRQPEAGRAFRPRVRARNVNGLGTAPVPARPPKD
jgi:fatty acid desaturase